MVPHAGSEAVSESLESGADARPEGAAASEASAAPPSEAPASATQKKGFSTASDESFPVPCVFGGRLLLLKLIARGGMGDVYLAATTGIEGAERPVIVKTVRRDHIHDGSFLARFLDEARVQSQLHHPGVAQVIEAATDDSGEPFVVVEYVEGRSLADLRQRAIQLGVRVGWPEAVAISIEIAQALAHVHERAGSDGTPLGIVHRDLSPQNVMIGYAGEVKLIDFGTARGHNRRCHTVAGVVFAKPGYVAPEVARQQVGDGRIDVYALGIMLWELCAGRRFLTGDAQAHLEDAAAGKVKVPGIAAEIGAPLLLDEVIQKLTANDPDDRFASASRAAAELGKVLQEAKASKSGERGVRGRVTALMKALWTHEPQRSRAEFARLLKDARHLVKERITPVKSEVSGAMADAMNEDSLLAGTPYRILSKIGEGASGAVYEAEHVELGRPVALKVLAPEHGSAKDAVERFRREARAIAGLSHPNLCVLYDFGRAVDGRVFLAMELLKGQTVEQYLKSERGMDWREAVAIGIEITKALDAAHSAGVVHRDLKPANLFLQKSGGVKLVDFGVAMALSDVASQSDEQRQKGFAIFGTPEYMAPEQVAGEPVDGRCDLYALGCVLYELVTGTPPFDGPSNVVIMGKHLREVPEPPCVRAPKRGIPASLDALIVTALAKKPENRFADAVAMREALEATLVVVEPPPSKARRRVAVAASVFAAALAGLVGFKAAPLVAVHFAPVPPAVAEIPKAETTITSAAMNEARVEPVAALPPTPPQPADEPMALDAVDGKTDAVRVDGPPADKVDGPDKGDKASSAGKVAAAKADRRIDPKAEAKIETKAATKADAPHDRAADLKRLTEARAQAKAKPADATALKKWAQAAYTAGDYKEARRATEAWMLRDRSPEPRLTLARVLDTMGRRQEARTVLQEVLEAHPDLVEARKMAAKTGAPMATPDAPTTRPKVARK